MANVKKTFVLRLDTSTFQVLSKWAADEYRSVNGQIEMILSKAIKEAKRDKLPAIKIHKVVKGK